MEKRQMDFLARFVGIPALFVLAIMLFYNGFINGANLFPEYGLVRSVLFGTASLGMSMGMGILYYYGD